MKKLEAIIRPFQVDRVKAALDRVGIPGLTLGEVHDVQPADAGRADPDAPADGLPKLKLEILLDDGAVDDAAETIAVALGEPLPLFVTPVDEVVRIRTGERGASAV